MKNRRPNRERRHFLSQLLDRRLVSYATAAAGSGILGLAQPAEAQIIYTPAHVTIGYKGSYSLDLTNDGTIDFILKDEVTANCSTVVDALMAKAALGNAIEGQAFRSINLANALKAGETIGASQGFVSPSVGALMGEAYVSGGGFGHFGNWLHVVNRYLGLRFQINGETHFGWARMTVSVNVGTLQSVLTGYAYESQPNTPIVAGQESGQFGRAPVQSPMKGADTSLVPMPPPQPASLGTLALGAQGLPLWRREALVAAV
jgi:hypothetical protein